MPTLTFETVAACLTDIAESDGAWHGPTLGFENGIVFGGQLLGQTLIAVSRLAPEFTIKSVTAHFPKSVRDTGDVAYKISTLHSGSAYATFAVSVMQTDRSGNESEAYRATVLAHRPGPGLTHASAPHVAAVSAESARPTDLSVAPWECRLASDTDFNDPRAQESRYDVWTRLPEAAREPALQQALLAYLSDVLLIGSAILPHEGWSQLDAHRRLRTAVLGHQIAFHSPLQLTDWTLLTNSSPASADGTAYGRGDVFDASFRLVASYSQEAMIRLPEDTTP